ncbi:hypothetical protein DSO57_1011319 [Entomophthora muscae]|uniref:Uncharacterized protein n=1 Tax=Entomophthora muscae TaxID=34485 RepID=A0ACC2T6D7_9FUNG|nr:hypothetical protein DSO57_1011319 [Entomophthora muscae]
MRIVWRVIFQLTGFPLDQVPGAWPPKLPRMYGIHRPSANSDQQTYSPEDQWGYGWMKAGRPGQSLTSWGKAQQPVIERWHLWNQPG